MIGRVTPITSLTIRAATLEDVPAVNGLVARAYRGDAARVGWTHEADLLDGQRTDVEAVTEIIRHPRKVILLAFDGDALVGCVLVEQQAERCAHLGMLSVEPARQACGLGRQLLAAAEAEAVARFGATRMEMSVIRQRTDLIPWYERRGYALTGETAPFPLDDQRFGLPKRRDLEFVVLAKSLAPPS
jgi:ribosomal protein S18 acetylase RimI-like enzyme